LYKQITKFKKYVGITQVIDYFIGSLIQFVIVVKSMEYITFFSNQSICFKILYSMFIMKSDDDIFLFMKVDDYINLYFL